MLIKCAFCKGKGKDPFGVPSKNSSCQVCNERGENLVKEPNQKCPTCKGTGVFFQHRLPCAVCKGKGFVTIVHQHKVCKDDEIHYGLEVGTGLPPTNCYTLGAFKPFKDKEKKKNKI